MNLSLQKQREQGMPDARCTRGLVCNMCKRMRTRAYRFSGGNPTFPAQWLYGLCRALPGDEFALATVACGLRICRARLGLQNLRRLDISNGCQDHTILPYASTSFVCAFVDRSQVFRQPALQSLARPTLPRPPHPGPTFVTMANAPREDRDAMDIALISENQK